jgi:hypothetical protein
MAARALTEITGTYRSGLCPFCSIYILWWKLVKSFMSKKGMPRDEIPPIEDSGKVHHIPVDKATVFNQYFVTQCTVENDQEDIPRTPEYSARLVNLLLAKN